MPQTSKYYLGIDPGLKGGIALIPQSLDESKIKLIEMPTTKFMVGDKLRNTVDEYAVLEILRKYNIIEACIERQWSRKGEGHVGAFTLGAGYAKLLTCLAAESISYSAVTAQEWRGKVINPKFNALKELVGDEIFGYNTKQMSVGICNMEYPHINLIPKGCRTPHDGIAEALLIATSIIV